MSDDVVTIGTRRRAEELLSELREPERRGGTPEPVTPGGVLRCAARGCGALYRDSETDRAAHKIVFGHVPASCTSERVIDFSRSQ